MTKISDIIDAISNFFILFKNIELLTLVSGIILVIGGWIFALWLQRNNAKHQHRIQIKYDIYKQFVQFRKETQDALSKLGAYSSPPFIIMDSCMIPFEMGLKKEYNDIWMSYSEHECVLEGEKKWLDFVQQLQNQYFEFTKASLKLFYVFEDWESALKPLLSPRDLLTQEIENFRNRLKELVEILQSWRTKSGDDWRKWDQKAVEKITDEIRENALTTTFYFHDFMVLIHNELLSSYFNHERPTRKTLDPKFRVLTKDGFIINLEKNHK